MDETTAASDRNVDGAAASTDEVSRIRDIIFGANMRDYERRFAELEQRLLQELTTLRADMNSRFDAAAAASAAEFSRVHDRVTNEVQRLGERLQAESDSRQASVQDLHDALQRARDDSDRRDAELQELLDHRVRELRDSKTDRHHLGEMLRQISDTLQAPSSDSRG